MKQPQQSTLEQALAADGRCCCTVLEELQEIWGKLIDFKNENTQTFEFLCTGGDVTLADAMQALAEASNLLEAAIKSENK